MVEYLIGEISQLVHSPNSPVLRHIFETSVYFLVCRCMSFSVFTSIWVLDIFKLPKEWSLFKKGRAVVFSPLTLFQVQFWFATGGAGFCLSRSLLMKMSSYIRNGGFELLGEYLKLPDDVTLGYLIGKWAL